MSSRARFTRLGVGVAVVSLLATFAHALPAAAQPYKPAGVQEEPKVFGRTVKPEEIKHPGTGRPFEAADPVWPGRSSVDVALPSARERKLSGDASGAVTAGGLPVTVASKAVSRARVQSLGRAAALSAGVDGVLLRVGRADDVSAAAPMRVSVDYRGFRHAYGGDWANRLRMAVLPGCALTTPSAPGCQAVAVPSVNDPEKIGRAHV